MELVLGKSSSELGEGGKCEMCKHVGDNKMC